MKTLLRIQLVLLVAVSIAGALLKSGQASARPLHKALGMLAGLAGLASVVQVFRSGLGRNTKILSFKALTATFLAGVCGKLSAGKPVGITYVGMIVFFLIAIVCVVLMLKWNGKRSIADAKTE